MTPETAYWREKFAGWCGWVLLGVLTLTPVAAWLGPLAFAPIMTLAGLLTLPALRVTEEDRPAALALLVLVIWAIGSTIWSAYQPERLVTSTAAKLVAEAVLFAAAACAARVAEPDYLTRALKVFAWGMAGLGLLMLIEGLTGAAVYRALRAAIHDPIRPDLGVANVAQALFVLALLLPAAALAAIRAAGKWWLIFPMVAGLVVPSVAFGYDAPVLALVLCLVAGGAVYLLPRAAPQIFAAVVALFYMIAPIIVDVTRMLGWYQALKADVEPSWSQRMGYWSHAADWISDHPERGWGLDASRVFAPGIILHPHDSALQIWLELGLIGATAAAVFWAAILAGLVRPKSDTGAAVGAATTVVYLTFSAFSFGVWQEWWLALGALALTVCIAVRREPVPLRADRSKTVAAEPSTASYFSE
jgi:O-antigen ligase